MRPACSPSCMLLLLLLLSAVVCQPATASSSLQKQLVLFDHDGGVDDFITLLLLLSSPHIKLIGITILDADSYAAVAANTTLKLLHLLKQPAIPVGVSSLGAVNPFPDPYRAQGLVMDVSPLLNRDDVPPETAQQLQKQPGQEVFAQLLLQQTEKVTVVATGPLSNLAYALSNYPDVADKIQQVWWMGGALRVRGNVFEPQSDGSAEWNAYWDPAALGVVWSSSVPLVLVLVPLDATNKVPITPDLVYSFGPQAHHLFSMLAGTFYAPVVNWVYSTPGTPYYAWDVLTAACMMNPALCKVEHGLQVAAVLTGPGQGATVLVQQQAPPQQAPSQQAPSPQQASTPAAAVQHQPPQGGAAMGGPVGAAAHVQRVLMGRQAQEGESLQDAADAAVGADAAAGGGVGGGQVTPAAAGAGVDGSVSSGSSSDSVGVSGTGPSSIRVGHTTGQLSAVKAVSAVVDVDAQAFHQYLLHSMRH